MKHIAVLGDDALGTAFAHMLAAKGNRVMLWCNNGDVARAIKENRINDRYLPGIQLPSTIIPTTSLDEAICGSAYVFEAIPVAYMRSVLGLARHCYSSDQLWGLLSKGIEQHTLMLPSQILLNLFGADVRTALVSGPSFAYDLARKQPTAVTLATELEDAADLQALLTNDYFRPYPCTDVIGAQVGGAVKNVIALASGILQGSGCADNTKAFLLTRGLQEMIALGGVLGGNEQTIYGLSGLGDLMLTALGAHSKNVAIGRRIGQGESLETLKKELVTLPEGINTVQSVHQLMRKHALTLPIFSATYDVIFNGAQPAALLSALMQPDA